MLLQHQPEVVGIVQACGLRYGILYELDLIAQVYAFVPITLG